jgi:hypothetical protein
MGRWFGKENNETEDDQGHETEFKRENNQAKDVIRGGNTVRA